MVKVLEKLSILACDDEMSAVMRRMLDEMGATAYAVRSIYSAREFISSGEKIDCLVTDLLLLNGSGDDLLREMQLIRPGLGLVLCTGVDLKSMGYDFERIRATYLPKPFNHQTLAGAILMAIGSMDTERPPRRR